MAQVDRNRWPLLFDSLYVRRPKGLVQVAFASTPSVSNPVKTRPGYSTPLNRGIRKQRIRLGTEIQHLYGHFPEHRAYYESLAELIEAGGSDNELSIRPASQNCLAAYCAAHKDKLVLVRSWRRPRA